LLAPEDLSHKLRGIALKVKLSKSKDEHSNSDRVVVQMIRERSETMKRLRRNQHQHRPVISVTWVPLVRYFSSPQSWTVVHSSRRQRLLMIKGCLCSSSFHSQKSRTAPFRSIPVVIDTVSHRPRCNTCVCRQVGKRFCEAD
jgi:hypothetical protein